MKLTVKLTNRAILLSGEDIKGNQGEIDCDLADLPYDERTHIAARLFEEQYVCEGVVDEAGGVVPLVEYGQPTLLCLDGIDVVDLVEAVRRDQEEVDDYLAKVAAKKEKPAA